jgi:parallel beta-helix repeat protein
MKKLLMLAVLVCSVSAWGQSPPPDCSSGFCAGVGTPTLACKAGNKYSQLDAPGTGWSCTGIPPHWVQDAGGGGGGIPASQLALVTAESFGAVGDWNGTTGTDNTTALQNAINSLQTGGICGQVLLQAKSYKVTGTLNITSSCVGIRGTAQGGALSLVGPSAIVMTSASADIIDVAGASSSALLEYNTFNDFAVKRTVAPTGTAAGLSFSYVAGADVTHVQSMDSARGFYFHMFPSRGVGKVEDCLATWAFGSVTNYTGGTYSGFYLDSADGNPEFSFRGRHLQASSNLSAASNVRGFDVEGTAIQDVMVYGLETAGGAYGIYVNHSGSSSFSSIDVHFFGSIIDAPNTSAIYVNGATAATSGRIEFNGGYMAGGFTAAGNLIDLENSTGINVTSMQIGPMLSATNYIFLSGVTGSNISNNQIVGVTSAGITLTGSTGNTIADNQVTGSSATTLISLTSTSTNNSITGNVLLGSATNGVATDSTSQLNVGFETNAAGSGITTDYNPGAFNSINVYTSGAAGAPALNVWESGITSYHQMAFGKKGAAIWQFGVGQTSETGLGVAGKLFFYDTVASKLAGVFDASDNFEVGYSGVLPTTFPARFCVGTTCQFKVDGSGNTTAPTYNTSTNCSSSASPAVCAASASGRVVVAAAATTVVVNTTAVTANSEIQLTFDSSLGTALSVTCNTTPVQPTVSARTAGTSFTITVPSAPTTNPACFSYSIRN